MTPEFRLVLVAAVAFLAGSASARERYRVEDCDPRLLAMVNAGPKWLTDADLTYATDVPDAATTQREIAHLLALQARRTNADVAKIRTEVGDLTLVFTGFLGTTESKKPFTFALLRDALAEVDYFLFAEKFRLMRLRPHQVDARIKPAIAVPRHPAFPSGHGGESRMLAIVAAELVPSRRAELEGFAVLVGTRRELAGVHFPSDTAEGIRIAEAVAKKMLALPAFRARVQAARSEWPAH